MVFVFRPQTFQNQDRFIDGRRFHFDCLEATFKRGVFFNVFAILIQRRCADALQLAPAERGLDDIGGVHRAFG